MFMFAKLLCRRTLHWDWFTPADRRVSRCRRSASSRDRRRDSSRGAKVVHQRLGQEIPLLGSSLDQRALSRFDILPCPISGDFQDERDVREGRHNRDPEALVGGAMLARVGKVGPPRMMCETFILDVVTTFTK